MNKTPEAYLRDIGALWEYPGKGPHAIYTLGGLHASTYFNSEYLSERTELLNHFLEHFVLPRIPIPKGSVDLLVSYLPFGRGVGNALSLHLDIPIKFADADMAGAPLDIPLRQRVLLVAGKSLRSLLQLLAKREARLDGRIVALGNFSERPALDGQTIISGFTQNIPRWTEIECPLCAAGSPAIRHARNHWELFLSVKD